MVQSTFHRRYGMSANTPCDPHSMKTPGVFIGLSVLTVSQGEQIALRPDACEFLHRLHEKGISTVVVASSEVHPDPMLAYQLFQACDFHPLFRGYIVATPHAPKTVEMGCSFAQEVPRRFPGVDIPKSVLVGSDDELYFAHQTGMTTVVRPLVQSQRPLAEIVTIVEEALPKQLAGA